MLKNKRLKILSIDGGGILGLYSCEILKYIENALAVFDVTWPKHSPDEADECPPMYLYTGFVLFRIAVHLYLSIYY
jgi:hypothetical protein